MIRIEWTSQSIISANSCAWSLLHKNAKDCRPRREQLRCKYCRLKLWYYVYKVVWNTVLFVMHIYIYIYIYICCCLFLQLFLDCRTVIDFQTSQFIVASRKSLPRRHVARCSVFIYESGGLHCLLVQGFGCNMTISETTSSSLHRQWSVHYRRLLLFLLDGLSSWL